MHPIAQAKATRWMPVQQNPLNDLSTMMAALSSESG
jgi:hypothetical protein